MDRYRRRADALKARLALAEASQEKEQAALIAIKSEADASRAARSVLQAVAEAIQQQASRRIASLASRCLDAVFDEPYEVQIKFEQKRNKTEAKIVFRRDELELTDPLNEAGGGCVDVAALAFRLAALSLSKPRRRKLLVLDEPWKNIRGRANRQRMRALIDALADEFGVQFVLNVDAEAYPEFLLGKVVEL